MSSFTTDIPCTDRLSEYQTDQANGVYYLPRNQKAVKRYLGYMALQFRYGQCGHLLVSKEVYRDFTRV
jgi:hypothetical protein